MRALTRHPLYERADTFKSALMLNGFVLCNDGTAPELVAPEWNFSTYCKPAEWKYQPILLDNGKYALQSELINTSLSKLCATTPIRAISYGRVYDGGDSQYPCHTVIEGVIADGDMSFRNYVQLWQSIAEQIYGVFAKASLIPVDSKTWKIEIDMPEDNFTIACTGEASSLAKTLLLGSAQAETHTWIFTIDVDAVTVHDYKLADRKLLYSPLMSFLSGFENDRPVLGNSFAGKAADILRKRGYREFSGLKIYETGCYKKMNMVQDSWDANNQGIQLKEALGNYTGLPTVLTPALEEALATNYKAQEETARIFEIGHIFLPGKKGGEPSEKIALSVGAYGPDIDKASFKKEVDSLLTEFGIRNHFFIPTDLAIAYNTSDCWLVLDEKMHYLETNFGSISEKALANHGIGTQAFMLQIELAPMEQKAAEEYAFTPTELL